MAASLLAVVMVALLAAVDSREYYSWQGPACGCRGAMDSTLKVDCTLPSANLTLQLDRAGSWLQLACQQNSTVVCAELEEARPLVEDYLVDTEGGRVLLQLRLARCALPAAPLRCLLALLGGGDVRRLWLQEARGPLLPEHVVGLEAVEVLRLDYDRAEGAAITEVPWVVLRALPALRSFSLLGAALRLLPAEGSALPLQSLELAAGTLTTLPQHAFRSTPNLTSLLLWSNRMEAIHEDAFVGLSQLVNVSLTSNRLQSLPAALFRDATRLSRLQLYDNQLAELPAGLFRGLEKLTEVELFGNRAPLTLPEELFSGCRSLRVLLLDHARLKALPARLLFGLPLKRLTLGYNPLRRLPAELLLEQRALETLDLTNASLEELPESLFRHAGSLRVLQLGGNFLNALGETLFVGAAELRELYLDHNRLQDLDDDTFRGLTRLTTLSLSHNALRLSRDRNTLRQSAPALGGAYERDGRDAHDDGEYVSPLNALTALERLDLSHNRVRLLCDDWRLVMLRLQRLDLSYNELEELASIDTYFLSNAEVDLSHNRIARFAPITYDEPPARLPGFDLGHNPFNCDCDLYELVDALHQHKTVARLELQQARCAEPPELRGLALRELAPERLSCAAEGCPAGCSCRVLPAARALELNCLELPAEPLPAYEALATRLRLHSAEDLARLPVSVRSVDVSGLNLTEPPRGAAGVLLDLRDNLLREAPVELLRRNCSLLLAGNPLECGCEAREGLAELAARRHLVGDYAALRCAAGGALPEDAAALCAARRWAALGGALAALGLAAAVLTATAHRYRVELRIMLRKLGCWDDEPEEEGEPKPYDAFVSFAHEDVGFVSERLVPALEGGRRPLRLCVHYRDWRVGELIPAQIARSVEGSRRTVVVLSRPFLHSLWARLELRAAHARRRLVVLLLDGSLPADRALDPELRAYLALNTYVRADDPLVWERLRDAVLAKDRRRDRLDPQPEPLDPQPPKPAGLQARLTADGKLVNAALPAPP